MAIQWGSYEGTGNRMRVGIQVTWTERDGSGSVGHGSGGAKATVEYWTQNQNSWSDDQKLNLGGAIDSSISFTNSQGDGVQTKRGERTYTYDYGGGEYGSSPGNRTFSASLTGAYNGITPSMSVTDNIPARPYAAPADPTGASVTRINDGNLKVSWVSHETNGEPYDEMVVERKVYPGSISGFAGHDWDVVGRPGGGVTNFNDTSTGGNRKYGYKVKAKNSVGESGYDTTGVIYTMPNMPTLATRSTSGADQVINWVNDVDYDEYQTEIWHAVDGVWDSAPLASKSASSTTHTHTSPGAGKHKYRLRTKTTSSPTLYSSYYTTSESAGSTSAPSAPTGLSPTGGVVVDSDSVIVLSWTHNPTDGSAQTAYEVQHRLAGAGTWTTNTGQITSSLHSYTLVPTYAHGVSVEWQVRTWGASATASSFSSTATFATTSSTPVKYPLVLDQASGRVEAVSTGLIPAGVIWMWATTTAPDGWLICDGSSLLRSSYANLFAVIGILYGSVDGTHFTLPDLRSRIPVGAGTWKALGQGDANAENVRTLQHTHGIPGQTAGINGALTAASGSAQGNLARESYYVTHDHGGATGQSGVNALPFLTLHFIIKT